MRSGEFHKRTKLGVLEWFHLGDKQHVELAMQQVQEIGIKHIKTGISWADYHTDQGRKWLEYLIPELSRHAQILPCLLYTPPSIGLEPKTSVPPKYPDYFSDFTHKILKQYGRYFDWVELWNEPNNTSEYDYRLDPDWSIFKEFIGGAADVVRQHKKKVLLGGMSPVDPGWLDYMFKIDLMKDFDAVGIHGFPGIFDTQWNGWKDAVQKTQMVIDNNNGNQEIWITEAGYSTWKQDEQQQVKEFINLMNVPVKQVFWYCLNDLNPQKSTIDGFHTDEREYHFRLVESSGRQKLLYRLLHDYGRDQLDKFSWITTSYNTIPKEEKSILITGGAGFIGINLADRLLSEGKYVTVLDNLQRPGVELNLDWLKNKHGKNLRINIADIRNPYDIQKAVNSSEFVFHLAAQVAVTTSYERPFFDFKTNAMGTMNILEAIRNTTHRPPLVFTFTNKVFGDLADKKLISGECRYSMEGKDIDETQKLDFYTPYGCSKGSAESYIRDYARLYNLKTVVFRMSCIYGPHQFGTKDQGWVAHFLNQAIKGYPITISGDGKQVRDILFIDDLLDAFQLTHDKIDEFSGEEFNLGGGYENSISLREFIKLIENVTGEKITYSYSKWRNGDQKYYVSDYTKFTSSTGWKPKINISEGLDRLYQWLLSAKEIELPEKLKSMIA